MMIRFYMSDGSYREIQIYKNYTISGKHIVFLDVSKDIVVLNSWTL